MGFVIMLIVVFVVFLIINAFAPWWLAFLCACAFLAAWFALNVHSAFGGMVSTNLRIYFKSRKQGATHEEALGWMIRTRYMNDPAKQAQVLDWVNNHSLHSSECDDIKAAIEHMFGIENGFETAHQATPKIYALIDKEYAKRATVAP